MYCVFLDQNVKIVISNLDQDGISQNMAAVTQHAIVEKLAGKGMFFLYFSPYSGFGLNFRHMVMPHMCCEMQNKLSKTRVSPLGSMG